MATMQIKSWITGEVLYEGEAETMGQLVASAVTSGANLYGANLSGANLSGANLSGADLYRADLSGANLYEANLYEANLYRANLSGADLYGANLYEANLSGSDLYGANLYEANLSGQHVYSFSGVGSARRMTTYWLEADKVWCGCFTGTLSEFEAQVNDTHGDNPRYLSEYAAGIAFLKAAIAALPEDEVKAGKEAYAKMAEAKV